MDKEDKLIFDNKNPYQLKVGDLTVEIKYSNNKKIEECILKILKQKMENGGER